MTLPVAPIYGWGWFTGPGTVVVEVPGEFTVEVKAVADPDQAGYDLEGTVQDGTFAGWAVQMAARNSPFNGNVSLRLRNSDEPEMVSGYAMIPIEALAE